MYQGSRGAGICLKDGVEAIAKGENGSGKMIVRFKNEEYDSRMYQDVLSELVEQIPEIGDFDWELDIIMSLPTSQGFGMSASGAVASSMAIQRAMVWSTTQRNLEYRPQCSFPVSLNTLWNECIRRLLGPR